MPVLPPAQFDAGQETQFKLWLHSELSNTMDDRASLERDWEDYIIQWRAKLPTEELDFPWPGAANVEFPLTAMHTDPVYADLIQSIHTTPDLWHVRARKAATADLANSFRKLLTRFDEDFLKMRQVNTRAFLDLVVLGTCVYKVHWRHEPRKVRDYDPESMVTGAPPSIIERTITDSRPKVESIPLQYFWIPANAWHIDPDAPVGAARWVAQEFWLTKNELEQKAQTEGRLVEPAYDRAGVDLVKQFEVDRRTATGSTNDAVRVDRAIQKGDNYQPQSDLKIRLFEVWARFDVDGDGIDEDVVLIWHQGSSTILRVLYNPYLHGKRPFLAARYLPGFGFYGIGLAEADEWAQNTASQLLNGLLNNVMLVNSRMFGAPLGSNIDVDEDWYPGKTWFLGPDEQIQSIQLADIYPSLPQTMLSLMSWSELRTGVNELRQGSLGGLPGRTPATTVLETLRLGNKRFDMILGNLRDQELGPMGMLLLQLFAQFLREDPVKWSRYLEDVLGRDEAPRVQQALLEISPADIPQHFGVTLTATTAITNKEADKQNFLGLVQLLSGIMPQLLELARALESGTLGPMATQVGQQMFTGGVELLERLVERFDIENPDEILPNAEAIFGSLQAQAQGINAAQQGFVADPRPVGAAQALQRPPLPGGALSSLFGLGG